MQPNEVRMHENKKGQGGELSPNKTKDHKASPWEKNLNQIQENGYMAKLTKQLKSELLKSL